MSKINYPKVSVVFDYNHRASEKNNKPGTVYVRVYNARDARQYISTGVRVLPSQWNGEIVVRREDAFQLNKIIQEQVDKCKQMLSTVLPGHQAPSTRQMHVDRSNASFLDWMRHQIETSRLATGTIRHHYTVLSSLENFGKIRRFEDVKPANIKSYIQWISQRTVYKMVDGKKVSVPIDDVTIYGYWKRLKKWIGVAQDEMLLPLNSMQGVKVPRGESKEKDFLLDEDIELWKNVTLCNVHLCEARDRFIVQMGTGLAYADLMKTDFTRHIFVDGQMALTGQRQKTKVQYFIPILPMAQEILKKWDFKIPPISNQKYNKYLKEVAEQAGISGTITSHVARHTYATQCLIHGISLESVQRTQGHKSIRTTERYAKMVNSRVIEEFKHWK